MAREIDVPSRKTLVMEAFFRVDINGPATVGNAIVKESVFQNVVLVENVVTY